MDPHYFRVDMNQSTEGLKHFLKKFHGDLEVGIVNLKTLHQICMKFAN